MLFLMEVLVIATNVICCHLLFFLLLSLSAIVIGYCLLSAIVVGYCLLLLLLLAVGYIIRYSYIRHQMFLVYTFMYILATDPMLMYSNRKMQKQQSIIVTETYYDVNSKRGPTAGAFGPGFC